MVEGPLVMMLSGIMVHLKIVHFWPIYLILMAGDLAGDTFWYYVGLYFARPLSEQYGKFFGLTPELIFKIKSIFLNHEKKILFISKITMGFGFAMTTLIVAGMSKMSFTKYISILFLGQFIFTAVLLGVGYFFGDLYTQINKDFQTISLIAFIIIVFFILRGITSYLRTQNFGNDSNAVL